MISITLIVKVKGTDNFADFNSTDGAYTEELQKYDNQTNLVPFATIQKGIIYQTCLLYTSRCV